MIAGRAVLTQGKQDLCTQSVCCCLQAIACSCDHGVMLRACMQGNSTASANAVSMALSQGAPATAISQAVAQVVSLHVHQLLIQPSLLISMTACLNQARTDTLNCNPEC